MASIQILDLNVGSINRLSHDRCQVQSLLAKLVQAHSGRLNSVDHGSLNRRQGKFDDTPSQISSKNKLSAEQMPIRQCCRIT